MSLASFRMSSRQIDELLAEILLLPLVHERLFLGRPVDLVLVLGLPFRAVGGMDAVMPVEAIAVAVLTVVAVLAIQCCRCVPFTAFTPLIPFLFFISTPPYSNEPPCSRGELIVAPPGAGQARNNGSRICGKIGAFRRRRPLPRRAHLGDFDLQAKLDLGQHRIEPVVAGGVAKVGRGRLQPHRVEGPSVPPRTSILSSSRASSAIRPRLTARRSLGRVVLALQRDQRVDAADGAERGGGCVDFGASPSSTEKPPAPRGAARTRSRPGRRRSIR